MDQGYDLQHYEKWQHIAGIDEVGVTAIAGPIVAACVVMPKLPTPLPSILAQVNDCKKVSDSALNKLSLAILSFVSAYGIGTTSVSEINLLGTVNSVDLAMRRAYKNCLLRYPRVPIRHCLIDGERELNFDCPYTLVPKGDTKSFAIAAASIVAKDKRDRLMKIIGQQWSAYDLHSNKGYASEAHLHGLDLEGLVPELHRTCLSPIRPRKWDKETLTARRKLWLEKTMAKMLG